MGYVRDVDGAEGQSRNNTAGWKEQQRSAGRGLGPQEQGFEQKVAECAHRMAKKEQKV